MGQWDTFVAPGLSDIIYRLRVLSSTTWSTTACLLTLQLLTSTLKKTFSLYHDVSKTQIQVLYILVFESQTGIWHDWMRCDQKGGSRSKSGSKGLICGPICGTTCS